MHIERQYYDKYTKSKKWSRANEPIWNRSVDDKYLHYPNMYNIYRQFSKIFHIPIDNFILTSGCEESLIISLQVLKEYIRDKEDNFKAELVYEYPSWGLSELIMDQFSDDNFILKRRDFVTDINKNKIKPVINKLIKSEVDYSINYKTSSFNGLFYHKDLIKEGPILNQDFDNKKYYNISKVNKESFNIIDEVYDLSCLRHINTFNEKNIYIGSFSKLYGPGFRLGYIIYDWKFDNLMKYYRPHYISQSGVELISTLLDQSNRYKYNQVFHDFDKALNRCIKKMKHFRTLFDVNPIYYSEHPNYISVDKESLQKYAGILKLNEYKINKEFKLNNINMVRLSRPLNFILENI